MIICFSIRWVIWSFNNSRKKKKKNEIEMNFCSFEMIKYNNINTKNQKVTNKTHTIKCIHRLKGKWMTTHHQLVSSSLVCWVDLTLVTATPHIVKIAHRALFSIWFALIFLLLFVDNFYNTSSSTPEIGFLADSLFFFSNFAAAVVDHLVL